MSDEERIAEQAAAEAIAETEEERTRKRKERLEQNRISARESRKRKKTMIEGELSFVEFVSLAFGVASCGTDRVASVWQQ